MKRILLEMVNTVYVKHTS